MATLHIDLETFSSVDIKKSGLYKYVQSGDFEILLFAYAYDGAPVKIVDLAQGEPLPAAVVSDLANPCVAKTAHNAAFEYYCLSKFYKTELSQWRCTMVHALYCGFPASLEQVGKAMALPEDKRKMGVGKALIRYFCTPCKPTKTNGGRARNLPKHDKDKWELFKSYCRQDVETEREVERRLSGYPVPDDEWECWRLDQLINEAGVAVDEELVTGAIAISRSVEAEHVKRAKELTGLDNPNSVSQLKGWVESAAGVEVESLDKESVSELLEKGVPDDVGEALAIRQELGKTSVKKYTAMEACTCGDGRIRGLLQFYGANRTGRWAGRLVQVQNLPKNHIGTLDLARDFVKGQRKEALHLIYGNVPDALSQLVRTAFVPSPGHHFVIADFSAIEARVVAWLSGEGWRLDVFRTHGKIYEASASAMFGVPIETMDKGAENHHLRAKGKIAELALGYGGGSGALISMGALNAGLTEGELPEIVKRWRGSNRRICDFWYAAENAATECVRYGAAASLNRGVSFSRDAEFLTITLPSGRRLYYNKPQIGKNEFGRNELNYYGLDQTSKKWCRIPTWGGKLVENIVQAVARDLLAHALKNLHGERYRINFHVHDEVVVEVKNDDGEKDAAKIIELMCRAPDWADGLPLNADGFEADYYKKD